MVYEKLYGFIRLRGLTQAFIYGILLLPDVCFKVCQTSFKEGFLYRSKSYSEWGASNMFQA